MVSGLFGPAEGALGAESILEASQRRKIVEVPSIAVVAWWNSAYRAFSMIVDRRSNAWDRKASTGRRRSANFLGIQRPVDHQLCGDIKNVIIQFWRHTIAEKEALVEITQEMWCSSWLCFDIGQGRTFCLHSGIGLDSVELA